MDRFEKRVLRRNTEKLAKVIIPTTASNKLFTANIITRLDRDNIRVEPVAYKANSLLLDSLYKSHKENAFPELMKIIENIDPQVAEAIKEEVEEERLTTVPMQESEVNEDHLPVSISETSASLEEQQHTDLHESRMDEDIPLGVSEMSPSLEGQDLDIIDGPVAITSAPMMDRPPVAMAFTVPSHFDGTSSVTGGTGPPDVGQRSEVQRQDGGLRLECKPTLLECQSLGIVSKMASNWSSLAIHLGLEDRMDRIDDDYPKVREKCSNVLKLWIKGKGRKHSKEPVTWKTLVDTIQKLYPSFADDLRTKFAK